VGRLVCLGGVYFAATTHLAVLRITHTRGPRAHAVEQFGHSPVRIGCGPGCDVAFQPGAHPGVMAHHAELRFEGGTVWVVDLGTPSGTYVAGARVQRRALANGEAFAIGDPAGGPELRVEVLAAPALGPAGRGPEMAAAGGPVAVQASDGAPPSLRVDVATAQRMVHAAVLEATRHDRAAQIVNTRVAAATRKASRINTLLAMGVLLAFGAAVVAAFFMYRSQRAAGVLAAEAGFGKKPTPAAAGTVPTQVVSGRAIFETNKTAIYVMGYLAGDRVGGCCTAFAIGPDLLATNAHCVIACKARGAQSIVTQNDSGGRVRFNVIAAVAHPEYKTKSESADSPDVGLLRVQGRLPKAVTLASDAELRSLGPGDDAFVIGFPGRVMDPLSPSATFLQGRIGRVMGFAEEATSADKSVLIQHDAVTRGGNSGSPIFNQYGNVIGVHAAHIDEENEVQVGGQKTKVVGASPFRIGMRIDLLRGVPAPR
jgi:V8-like Glu-specific endopeptidase